MEQQSRIQPLADTLLVNFGGPRNLEEIFPFLKELLCDRDVVYTRLPNFLHNYLFTRVAKKRSLKIREDYELIGGKSPIYFDTEHLSRKLEEILQARVFTFHRYLPETHEASLQKIEESKESEIRVFPLFPQFTFATTGSIARFFSKRLSPKSLQKLRWIPSYAEHPFFISAFQKKIRDFLSSQHLKEEDTFLLFSAHGVPKIFIEKKDPYQKECEKSFEAIFKAFPKALGKLCYQSKFGSLEWIQPPTDEICETILQYNETRKNIVFIPLSFPSDHIETLFEVEYQYLPIIRKHGLNAYRCPALNLESYWIESIASFFLEKELFSAKTHELIQ